MYRVFYSSFPADSSGLQIHFKEKSWIQPKYNIVSLFCREEELALNNEIVRSLISQVTEEVFAENKDALEKDGIQQNSVQLAVKLSAITAIKILEKLELIDKD